MNPKWRWIASGLFLLAAIGALALPRIPQSPGYHQFADQRALLGIPHCLDVVSNLGFLVAGIWGIVFILRTANAQGHMAFLFPEERWPYLIFSLGVMLTTFGSAYYHLAPDNARLVWDRLPMAMGFMALLAAVVGERTRAQLASRMLAPLILVGIGSVLYWHWTELSGRGDLRLYGLVQFGSLAAVVLMCSVLPSRYTRGGDMFVVVGFYALAKVFEGLDKQIYAVGGFVSGHTLKHLTAALACYWVLRMVMRRQPQAETPVAA